MECYRCKKDVTYLTTVSMENPNGRYGEQDSWTICRSCEDQWNPMGMATGYFEAKKRYEEELTKFLGLPDDHWE